MTDYVAGAVLTAASLDTAFNTFTINAQTGTTYTLVAADAGGAVSCAHATSTALTVPPNATVAFETGTKIRVLALTGAGTVTITAGAGVTLLGTLTLTATKHATLVKTATNTWYVDTASTSSSTARVDTAETTTSTTFVDLATPGPAVTLTTGTKALVIISARLYHSTGGFACAMGFAVSGASTVAAAIADALINNGQSAMSLVRLVTGLTAGSNTFTAKYESQDAGTSNFQYRTITVIDLGS